MVNLEYYACNSILQKRVFKNNSYSQHFFFRKKNVRTKWYAQKKFVLFFFEMVEPVDHVSKVEGDKFANVAFLHVQRRVFGKHLEQTC